MAKSRSEATRSRREELERARLAQAAKERKLRIGMVSGGLVVIVAVLIIVIVTINQKSAGGVVTPTHGDADQTGIVFPKADALQAGAPTLEIFTDFQCPICKDYETGLGDTIQQIMNDGSAKVVFRTMTFLDGNLSSQNSAAGTSKSSNRAAIAAACADTIPGDLYYPFVRAIFDNQPATEGDGYSDAVLRDTVPGTVGIQGADLTTFQQCYDKRQTGSFVQKVHDNATAAGIKATPTFRLNGTDITKDLKSDDPKTLTDAIAAVTEASAAAGS